MSLLMPMSMSMSMSISTPIFISMSMSMSMSMSQKATEGGGVFRAPHQERGGIKTRTDAQHPRNVLYTSTRAPQATTARRAPSAFRIRRSQGQSNCPKSLCRLSATESAERLWQRAFQTLAQAAQSYCAEGWRNHAPGAATTSVSSI